VLSLRKLEEYLGGLRAASLFEQAAGRTLAAMLAKVSTALADGAWSSRAKVSRGIVHLRPSSGYRQLAVLEVGSEEAVVPRPDSMRLPSMTAWRLVAQYGCAAAIDVNTGLIEPHGDGAPVLEATRFGEGGGISETRQRLIERGISHVYVLPLRGTRGAIEGMISLEAECRAAMGQPFVWQACADETPWPAARPPP